MTATATLARVVDSEDRPAVGNDAASRERRTVKLAATRDEMNAKLIERHEEIDICLTALVAGHHPLLVGEPGTAKSVLGRTVAAWCNGEWFEYLLNKHTDPSELFGPVSIEAFKREEYKRIIDNTLLTAHVAFLDEIFKGSTAILNCTLGVLNERKYRNGRTVIACPLQMAVAASNEWPQDGDGCKELGALFDRFLLRKTVREVRSPEGQDRLLFEADLTPRLSTTVTPAEIEAMRTDAAALPFTEDAKEAIVEIIRQLAAEGIRPGDRRKRWSVGACRAFAYLYGADEVKRDHLEILAHTFWVDPREQPDKVGSVVAKVANPLGMEVAARLAEAHQVVAETDLSELEKVFVGVKKLKNVAEKLKALGTSSRVTAALKYVNAKIDEMKAKGVAAKM